MPNNLSRRRVVDQVNTTLVHSYEQADPIAPFVAPVVMVDQRGGKVIQFDRSLFALIDTKRAPGDFIKRIRTEYGSTGYEVEQYALGAEVTKEDAEDASDGAMIDLRREAINRVNEGIAQDWERDVVNLITNEAEYETTNSIDFSADPWDSPTSDPEADTILARQSVSSQIGRPPTRGVIAEDSFYAVKLHPLFRDRIKHTTSGVVTQELLAQWFGLSGGLMVAERSYLDKASDDLVKFLNGSMVIFYHPEDARKKPTNFANKYGNGIFMNKNANSKARPSAWYTYQYKGYPYAEPEYKDKSSGSYITNVFHEQTIVRTSLGKNGLIGAACFMKGLVSP